MALKDAMVDNRCNQNWQNIEMGSLGENFSFKHGQHDDEKKSVIHFHKKKEPHEIKSIIVQHKTLTFSVKEV